MAKVDEREQNLSNYQQKPWRIEAFSLNQIEI
jgi:hypothetical protein